MIRCIFDNLQGLRTIRFWNVCVLNSLLVNILG